VSANMNKNIPSVKIRIALVGMVAAALSATARHNSLPLLDYPGSLPRAAGIVLVCNWGMRKLPSYIVLTVRVSDLSVRGRRLSIQLHHEPGKKTFHLSAHANRPSIHQSTPDALLIPLIRLLGGAAHCCTTATANALGTGTIRSRVQGTKLRGGRHS
jgi:hypothetical protein